MESGEGYAKVWLSTVEFANWSGYNAKELNRLLRLVRWHRAALTEAWHEHFKT